jgi:microcin C transport system permease protein
MFNTFKNPIFQKRLLRFKELKRAHISLWILFLCYLISLGSELICNSTPLYVRFNGQSYLPIFKFYPENIFTKNSKNTRPDYKKINASNIFAENPDNFMIFPPVPFGPFESIDPASIDIQDRLLLIISPAPFVGTVNIAKDYSIARSFSGSVFMGKNEDALKGLLITDYFQIPEKLKHAVDKRFANQRSSREQFEVKDVNGKNILIFLSEFSPRTKPPRTVRLKLQEIYKDGKDIFNIDFKIAPETDTDTIVNMKPDLPMWKRMSDADRKIAIELVNTRRLRPVDPVFIQIEQQRYLLQATKQDVRFPFPPVSGHIMGIDSAGRDVFARVLYGLRTSLTFGFMLVVCSMFFGVFAGAVQGYYGGVIDITGQRLIEIWSALPFLYIMILMGSVYGRSFALLLVCYGIFNWIGISYYIRAEFFRLRKQPFVEAATCLGISSKGIMFRHILPNALIPVITFSPFSLVGAIGSLAALDYLGFGLPPPTPSWGELLFQAQQYRWAWWLILYPSMALFIVMLCGVFLGEGIRNAYDPKRYARIE